MTPLPANRLGVAGWPVAHSRSPAMHTAALQALGLSDSWSYQLLPIPPEAFAETVEALPEQGFAGINVTIPHKEAALELADTATDAAEAIGAANTLTFLNDGRVEADNTDAPGLLAALDREVAGASALVLGAGGSARAVVWALVQAGATDVHVWNRTPERAIALARDLGAGHVAEPVQADILVNCTSIGLAGEPLSELPVTGEQIAEFEVVADLVYAPGGTALIAAAEHSGVPAVDGLEVLVRQGALSLQRWTGVEPPLDVMRAAARDYSGS